MKLKSLVVSIATASAVIVAPSIAHAATVVNGGDRIVMQSDGGEATCTLAGTARDAQGNEYGVTSGHCVDPAQYGGAPLTAIVDANGQQIADMTTLQFQYQEGDNFSDIAWFRLADGVTGGNQLRGGGTNLAAPLSSESGLNAAIDAATVDFPVAGYISTSELRPGDVVFKDGQNTARTVGVVVNVDARTGAVFAIIPAIAGDSGSPLYVVRGGKAYIVGNLNGGSPVLFNVFNGTQAQLAAAGLG